MVFSLVLLFDEFLHTAGVRLAFVPNFRCFLRELLLLDQKYPAGYYFQTSQAQFCG
jgi:hypothetical protein